MAEENVTININAKNNTKAAFAGAAIAITGFNQALAIAQKVMQVAKRAYEELIEATVDYAMQVRDMNLLIGASAEESSKLIQAADDVFISYDTMTKAMQAAIRQGVSPTIEGMGQLADQYVAIQDPIAKTKFLMDNFGRAGADLAPLMELGSGGIKELGDEAEKTGLVLDQKGVDSAIRFKEAVDQLNDTVEGLKVSIGMDMLPTLNLLLLAFDRGIDRIWSFFNVLGLFKQGSYAGFIDWLGDVTGLTDEATEGLEGVEDGVKGVGSAIANLPQKANPKRVVADLIDPFEQALDDIATIIQGDLGQQIEDFYQGQADLQQEIWAKEQEIATARAQGYSEQGTKIQGLYGELDGLKGKYAENATAHEEATKRIIYDMMQQRLASSMLSTQVQADVLAQLGMQMGLWDEATANMITGVDEVVAAFESGKINATDDIQTIIDYLMSIPSGKTFTLTTVLNNQAIQGLVGGMGGQYYWDIFGFANGGNFSAGQPMVVGEEGPEVVRFDRPGTVIPNGAGGGGSNITVVINTPVNLADETWVERKLYPYIKRGLKEAVRGA